MDGIFLYLFVLVINPAIHVALLAAGIMLLKQAITMRKIPPNAQIFLVALLAVAAGSGSLLRGTMLLLLYGVGHGALAVLAGSSIGAVNKLTQSERYGALSRVLKIGMGVLILLIGLYLFYLGF